MSESEIIKALQCCKVSRTFEDCDECPYCECSTKRGCVGEMIADALDLISSKNAEIERLQNDIAISRKETKRYATGRAEAIKVFVERMKEKASSCVASQNGHEIYETKQYSINAVKLDILVKEMTGENNGN
jgi:hypothetical protein